MKTQHTETSLLYTTQDKDYGRTLLVGQGYGQIDMKEYQKLEELAK